MFGLVFLGILFVCILLPVACMFLYLKKEQRKDRKSPLVDDLLRLPGASLNLQLREKTFDLLQAYSLSIFAPAIFLLVLAQRWIDPEKVRFGLFEMMLGLLILGVLIWSGWQIVRALQQLIALRRGQEGEQATAQLLSPLLAQGWIMLHDLPMKRGNIDHVLVGPTGVYALETKYRSKRASLKGQEGARAEYNGEAIRFAGGSVEALPIQQAKAVAAELSKFLRGRLGEEVVVVPVVALPGWFVKTTQRPSAGGAYVINPKNTALFLKRPVLIDESLRNRVVAALSELAVVPAHAST